MNDLIEIPHDIYVQMVFNLENVVTNDLHDLLGIKFIQTIKSGTRYKEDTKYLFEILDEKKLFLYKIEYGF